MSEVAFTDWQASGGKEQEKLYEKCKRINEARDYRKSLAAIKTLLEVCLDEDYENRFSNRVKILLQSFVIPELERILKGGTP